MEGRHLMKSSHNCKVQLNHDLFRSMHHQAYTYICVCVCLDWINTKIVTVTKINKWKNTASIIQWFKLIENQKKFICFDVKDLYPSISQELLNKALDFTSTYKTTSQPTNERFLKPQRKFGYNTGLSRDHCLAITDNTTRATKNKNKNLLLIQRQRAWIPINANKQVVNFLDVTFNVTQNT